MEGCEGIATKADADPLAILEAKKGMPCWPPSANEDGGFSADYAGATVWYQWVSSSDSKITIDTLGSDFDTHLAVLVAESASVSGAVAVNEDDGSLLTSRVTFTAKANQKYYLQVSGKSASSAGHLQLNWSSVTITPPPTVPSIYSFTPTRGYPGTLVTLNGMHLDNINEVRLNGVVAPFTLSSSTLSSSTTLQFVVPQKATSGSISARAKIYSATSQQAFTVLVDSAAPPAVSILTPGNGSTVPHLTAISGTASDTAGGSGLASVSIFLRRTNAKGIYEYWGPQNGVWAWRTSGTWFDPGLSGGVWTTTSNLPSGSNLSDGLYTINAYALDHSGNKSPFSSCLFRLDSVAPTVRVTTPINGSNLKTLVSLTGTATDNASGISRVALQLMRTSDGKYWSPQGWTVTASALSATISSQYWKWEGPLPTSSSTTASMQLTQGAYSLQVTAVDLAGNQTSTRVSFAIDYSPPILSIEVPKPGSVVSSLLKLSGSVADDPTGAGIKSVALTLKRNSDAYFWNGSGWVASSPVPLSAVLGQSQWSRTAGLPSASTIDVKAQLKTGSYTLVVNAVDKAGNLKAITGSFTFDNIAPPPPVITLPRLNTSLTNLTLVAGTARDESGGSGIREVYLRLKRMTDSLFWDGKAWAALPTDLLASRSGQNWTLSTALPKSGSTVASCLTPGQYEIFGFSYDNAGHKSQKSATVQITVLKPSSALVGISKTDTNASPEVASEMGTRPTSGVQLSDASADRLKSCVQLVFTGNVAMEADQGGPVFMVWCNGKSIPVTGYQFNGKNTVIVLLPEESFHSEDSLRIEFTLRDSKNQKVLGNTTLTVPVDRNPRNSGKVSIFSGEE